MAKLFQEGVGGMARRHGRRRQRIAQVRRQVEAALLRQAQGVVYCLRAVVEQLRHLLAGLQAEVRVGPDVGEGPVNGRVEPGGHQRVLQPVALRGVVVHVVAGDGRRARTPGQGQQFVVAGRVAGQVILLQFHVDRLRAEAFAVLAEQRPGLLPAPLAEPSREGAAAAAGEQDQTLRVRGQPAGVQPRLTAVLRVGQAEESTEVAVALAAAGQQGEARAVKQRQLGAGDRPDIEAVGQARELQAAAEVDVGQGQGRVAIFFGLGQQLVDVGRARPEGVKAFGVQLDVARAHARTPAPWPWRYQHRSRASRNRVMVLPSSLQMR